MMKRKVARIRKQIDNFMFDHYVFKTVLDYMLGFFVAAISAAVFAFGFACFTTPADPDGFTLATGGVSGISQVIALLYKLISGSEPGNNIIQSVGYTVLNIPLLIFSFFKISKRFTIFTLVNVVLSSIFITLLSSPINGGDSIAKQVATFTFTDGTLPLSSVIVRVLFAGICTGLSSAFAYNAGISCGGIDIVSYYLGARKSTSIGKYSIVINGFIVITYALLKALDGDNTLIYSLYSIIFSVLYIMVVGFIIDSINQRNKKMEVLIITNKEHMSEIMVANFPHSATVVKGHGAYSGADRNMLWMAVSSSEVKRVVAVARKVDEHAFITVTPLKQVYGNFFIKPLD